MEYYRIRCRTVFEYYRRSIPKCSMVLEYDGRFTNILPQQ